MQGQPNVHNIMIGKWTMKILAKEASAPQDEGMNFEPIQEEGKYFDCFQNSYDETPIEYFSGTVPQVEGFDFNPVEVRENPEFGQDFKNQEGDQDDEEIDETLEDRISREMDDFDDFEE